MSKLSTLNISFPSILTANFFTIALPMLLTKFLFGSAVVDNSTSKETFAVSGSMMSSLPKFGNQPEVIDFGQSRWDYE